MEEKKSTIFNSLIDRYFEGSITHEEADNLSELLKNKENLEIFDAYKANFRAKNLHDNPFEANWHRVRSKINIENHLRNAMPVRRKLFKRVLHYAAVFVAALLVATTALYLSSSMHLTNDKWVIEAPRGEKTKVMLPDGSEVWLNSNSKLEMKGFTLTSRKVNLSGEAFFKIAHNSLAPFVVRTSDCDVKVLGTEFNVMAYESFGRNEIALVKGKVEVKVGNQKKCIVPGEILKVENKKISVKRGEVRAFSEWVENRFSFNKIPIDELVMRLENWYDVDIELISESNRPVNFTGVFKNDETIWEVLDAVKVYLPIEYMKKNTGEIRITVR